METGGWKKRLLEWGDEAAQSFIALSSSGLIIIGIVVILWGLSEPHPPALHNHLWSYNFQLSPADECTPPRWDCALSDELENTWICVPRSGDARLHRREVGEPLGSRDRLHLTEH